MGGSEKEKVTANRNSDDMKEETKDMLAGMGLLRHSEPDATPKLQRYSTNKQLPVTVKPFKGLWNF
jgi:hypothetical protein